MVSSSYQVQDKLSGLKEERDSLHGHWERKQRGLEGTHLEQVFYRDTESMEKITNSQEVRGQSWSIKEYMLCFKTHIVNASPSDGAITSILKQNTCSPMLQYMFIF